MMSAWMYPLSASRDRFTCGESRKRKDSRCQRSLTLTRMLCSGECNSEEYGAPEDGRMKRSRGDASALYQTIIQWESHRRMKAEFDQAAPRLERMSHWSGCFRSHAYAKVITSFAMPNRLWHSRYRSRYVLNGLRSCTRLYRVISEYLMLLISDKLFYSDQLL